MSSKTPPNRTSKKKKSSIGDFFFWLIVVVLMVIAIGLITMVLWDGWKTAVAEPTEIFFSPPVSANVSATPVPETQLELSLSENSQSQPQPVNSSTPNALETLLSPDPDLPTSGMPAQQPMKTEVFQQELNDESLRDDFSTPLIGWSTVTREASSRGYAEGAYFIEVTAPAIYALSFIPAQFNPVIMEFDTWATSEIVEGTYGVLCQYLDENTFYLVEINPQTNQFAIGIRKNGIYTPLTDPEWQSLVEYQPEFSSMNRFEISCQPEQIVLTINGQQNALVEVLDPVVGGTLGALFVSGGQGLQPSGLRIYFDNFQAGASADAINR